MRLTFKFLLSRGIDWIVFFMRQRAIHIKTDVKRMRNTFSENKTIVAVLKLY